MCSDCICLNIYFQVVYFLSFSYKGAFDQQEALKSAKIRESVNSCRHFCFHSFSPISLYFSSQAQIRALVLHKSSVTATPLFRYQGAQDSEKEKTLRSHRSSICKRQQQSRLNIKHFLVPLALVGYCSFNLSSQSHSQVGRGLKSWN